VVIPAELCARLPDRPSVCAVGPLLREAILALTDRREARPDVYARLRAVLVDELVEAPEQSLQLPEPRDDRLRAVTELMYADPGQTTTLAKFGRAVGASERTLSRLFQLEVGMSFSRWRTMLRIHHALTHLTDGLSVTATSIACGWSNPTSFIEAFTSVIGQTPGRYQLGLRAPRNTHA
jgi:transcriptional regulator GlxA family with amidase domain